MLALGRRPAPSFPEEPGDGGLPAVAILLSAHNEETVIRQRLENLEALHYPADRIQVFVGVDGGEDRTAEIAAGWAQTHPRVHVFVSPENYGKTAMLKKLVGEIGIQNPESRIQKSAREPNQEPPDVCSLLVFTDANTMFAPDALKRLVAPFKTPGIGGVCGRLVFQDDAGAETRENLYWRAETSLKTAESRLDSCLGANGAIYAIRRELFWADIPGNTIIDDFVIGMKVREMGFRMIYESRATAMEQTPARIADEWRRRVRIGAGAFQSLALCRACLSPRYGRFALCFWSHKVLRWVTPHLLLLLAAATILVLLHGPGFSVFSAAVLAAGATFTGLAVLGRFMGPLSRLKAFDYFLSMQVALFMGFVRYCRGGVKGSWKRTERG
jgi:cellulose synthase/poly-beta-1,6-N-acetylglucosamine synthase-like glycosyltransferase